MEYLKEIQELNLVMSKINGMSFKWAQEHNVNPYEAKVLYALSGDEPETQRHICEVTGMPKQTVNNIIRALSKDEMIILIPYENDKREKTISLTEKGRHYLQNTLKPVLELEAGIVQHMGKENYYFLLKCLTSYSEAMEQEMGFGL